MAKKKAKRGRPAKTSNVKKKARPGILKALKKKEPAAPVKKKARGKRKTAKVKIEISSKDLGQATKRVRADTQTLLNAEALAVLIDIKSRLTRLVDLAEIIVQEKEDEKGDNFVVPDEPLPADPGEAAEDLEDVDLGD